MDKKSVQERIAQGEWAKRLKEDPIFKAIVNGMMIDVMGNMIATDNKEKVYALHADLKAIEKLQQVLLSLENDATKARSEGT